MCPGPSAAMAMSNTPYSKQHEYPRGKLDNCHMSYVMHEISCQGYMDTLERNCQRTDSNVDMLLLPQCI